MKGPLSFLLDEREIEVRTTLESWRDPDYLCLEVEVEDGRVFDLRHHEDEDYWELKEAAGDR